MEPGADSIDRVVRMALLEDAPWGDLTSQALIPATARMSAELVARDAGVFCGGQVFAAAMSITDANTTTELL